MTMPQNQTDIDFTASKFYMWRTIVAMAHADSMVHDDERAYLTRIFDNMKARAGLPQDYYDTLLTDLESPQDCAAMLSHVNDPNYRAQIIYFARLLAYKDGALHPSEEALLEKLHTTVTDNLPMEEIRKEVRSNVSQELVIHEVKMNSLRPTEGLNGLIDQLCLHFGIDLLDE